MIVPLTATISPGSGCWRARPRATPGPARTASRRAR
jgi:hypothetical protein